MLLRKAKKRKIILHFFALYTERKKDYYLVATSLKLLKVYEEVNKNNSFKKYGHSHLTK
jgi:hypothetical protein